MSNDIIRLIIKDTVSKLQERANESGYALALKPDFWEYTTQSQVSALCDASDTLDNLAGRWK